MSFFLSLMCVSVILGFMVQGPMQTLFPRPLPISKLSRHVRDPGMLGDSSPSVVSQRGWAVCVEGGVPGLRNRFPRLCCPNLTLRNSSPLREKEADRPTDGCRRKERGRIDCLLPQEEKRRYRAGHRSFSSLYL